MARDYIKLTRSDLREIRDYALEELDRFLYRAGSPAGKFRAYRSRLIAICLCQGAAQHYAQCTGIPSRRQIIVRRSTIREKRYRLEQGRVLAGLKDIDVWFFFKALQRIIIPDIRNCRKHSVRSFTRLGQRELDFMKKAIKKPIRAKAKGNRPADIVRSYLEHGGTKSSKCLSKSSIIGLYPKSLFGRLIWNIDWLMETDSQSDS